MKIAVLGWGSLIWDPRDLMIEKNKDWKKDGPLMPIEFARISMNGTLTLVIKENASIVQVLWTYMKAKSLTEAMKNLQQREGTPHVSNIGYIDLQNTKVSSKLPQLESRIYDWAKDKEIDAVIWTALGVKFKDKIGIEFNPKNVVGYLNRLSKSKKALAKKYIHNTPKQIRTEYREIMEKEFLLENKQ
jgi:hypothetical protein